MGSGPPRGVYRRHEPEKTALHGIVRDHLESFLARARDPDCEVTARAIWKEFRRLHESEPERAA